MVKIQHVFEENVFCSNNLYTKMPHTILKYMALAFLLCLVAETFK